MSGYKNTSIGIGTLKNFDFSMTFIKKKKMKKKRKNFY
jgi:hypothetical protein